MFGALPHWERLKTLPRLRAGLDMANAAVVGILLAALYDPVFTSAVRNWIDVPVALGALLALLIRVPPWLVVIACGVAGLLPAALRAERRSDRFQPMRRPLAPVTPTVVRAGSLPGAKKLGHRALSAA